MKRSGVAAIAVVLALGLYSLALAGNPSKKGDTQANKLTATGTIASVDAKQHSITLSQAAGQQQVQAQSTVPQKTDNNGAAAPTCFHVGEKTIVTTQSAQQGAQSSGGFDLLKVGQMVRIVYVSGHGDADHKGGKKPGPAQQITGQQNVPGAQSAQSVPVAPKVPGTDIGKPVAQVAVGSAQQTVTQGDVPAVPQKGKGKTGAQQSDGKMSHLHLPHALSIEILADAARQAK
jgi:hypothetical protein